MCWWSQPFTKRAIKKVIGEISYFGKKLNDRMKKEESSRHTSFGEESTKKVFSFFMITAYLINSLRKIKFLSNF